MTDKETYQEKPLTPPTLSWGRYFFLGVVSLFLCSSIILSVFTPFPLVLAVILYGRKKGVLLGLAGLFFSFLFIRFQLMGPLVVVVYALSLLIAVGISEISLRRIHPIRGLILLGTFLFTLLGGTFASGYFLMDGKFKEYLVMNIEKVSQELHSRKTEYLEEGGEEAREVLDFFASPQKVADEVIRSIPTTLFIASFFWVWVNLLLIFKGHRLFESLGVKDLATKGHTEKDLLHFKVPDKLVWAVVGVLVFALLGDRLYGPQATDIAISLLQCLGLFYFFQGFGIMIDFLDYIRLAGFLRSLLVVFTVITGAWAIAALGLFDMWINFRKFFKRNKDNT